MLFIFYFCSKCFETINFFLKLKYDIKFQNGPVVLHKQVNNIEVDLIENIQNNQNKYQRIYPILPETDYLVNEKENIPLAIQHGPLAIQNGPLANQHGELKPFENLTKNELFLVDLASREHDNNQA